jgi:hypothetical protein
MGLVSAQALRKVGLEEHGAVAEGWALVQKGNNQNEPETQPPCQQWSVTFGNSKTIK